jgi:hypothetical protein
MLRKLIPAAILFAACNNNGTVNLTFEIANANERTVTLKDAGDLVDGTTTFEVANHILMLDAITIGGENILEAQTPVRFDDAATVTISKEVAAGDFDEFSITIGIADAVGAEAAGEPNILDRSTHNEGEFDSDGDGIVDSGIVVYAPFNVNNDLTFTKTFTVEKGGETNLKLQLDLQTLLGDVDVALAEEVEGEFAITEDNATDQSPIVDGAIVDALTLVD